MSNFNALQGETLVSIIGLEKDSERVEFLTKSGRRFLMHHIQDCCEDVRINDVCGDVSDLLDSPITMATCETNSPERAKAEGRDYYIEDSCTWTFYKLATVKGYVTIRWYGESNGYYSEEVHFSEID